MRRIYGTKLKGVIIFMNFADSIKKSVIEAALKKDTVFEEEFVSREELKNRINLIRVMEVEDDREETIKNALCDVTESLIDSVPVITIKIDK